MGRRTATPRRAVVLTSDTGAGHRSVSRALVEAAAERSGLDLVEVDPLAPLPGALRPSGRDEPRTAFDRVVQLYAPVIVRAPWVWGWGFRLVDNEQGLRLYLAVLARRFGERIVEVVERLDADVLVSVHPLVNHLMLRARGALRHPDLPLMTVLTDLVDIHHWWVARGIDQYVASSDVAAARLAARGVPPARISTLGIPIRREFARMARSARETRAALALEPDQPVLLLMGGGEGAGRLLDTARAIAGLSRRGQRFQLVVIAGRNERVRQDLERQAWPLPTRVLGYTRNIAEYMTAADVVATKPGSLTVSEALALGRPLLLGRPLPGQEEGNVGYVQDAGAGLAYRSPAEAAEAAACLLSDAALRWEMGQRAARISHPRATERTVDLIQALALRAETPRRDR
jgi:1,2-diacylglycerol 3-beta-galactosyltransferase